MNLSLSAWLISSVVLNSWHSNLICFLLKLFVEILKFFFIHIEKLSLFIQFISSFFLFYLDHLLSQSFLLAILFYIVLCVLVVITLFSDLPSFGVVGLSLVLDLLLSNWSSIRPNHSFWDIGVTDEVSILGLKVLEISKRIKITHSKASHHPIGKEVFISEWVAEKAKITEHSVSDVKDVTEVIPGS